MPVITYKPMMAPLILIRPLSEKEIQPMDDFEQWLEFEFPFHSTYDFNTTGEYEAWKRRMRRAFEAGWDAGKNDAKGLPQEWHK